MTGFIDDIADQAIEHGMGCFERPEPYLRALVRLAGERLAAVVGHDEASAQHASLSRRHAVEATRAKGRNRK
ncbi:MAG: hypothetical protein ACOY4K_06375 [Pseudomonadota bacterium]